jgi:hypothetical protein
MNDDRAAEKNCTSVVTVSRADIAHGVESGIEGVRTESCADDTPVLFELSRSTLMLVNFCCSRLPLQVSSSIHGAP